MAGSSIAQLHSANKVVDLVKDYGDKGLQVIAPEYEGGFWHAERQLNERICATSLYNYDSEDITPNRLAVRQQFDHEYLCEVDYYRTPDDSDYSWLSPLYGLDYGRPLAQEVGSVEVREGPFLTFPNILQHQVQLFELADPTKPGHSKILALFLVDRNVKIISTVNVPSQRKDWWVDEVRQYMGDGRMKLLPVEVQDIVFDCVNGFPVDMKEAKELRMELIRDRKQFMLRSGYAFTTPEIALNEP